MDPRLPLILASSSPRRAELMRQLGVPFEVMASAAKEAGQVMGLSPGELACVNARLKAYSVACDAGRLIVAADTIIVLEDTIIGKPVDATDARAMLRRLSGRTHNVVTGLYVGGRSSVWLVDHVETLVTFGKLTDDLIAAYVATGEPLDKAGAYGIQGRGAILVERIEGDYFNVVGLPLARLAAMLGELGVEVTDSWKERA